MAKSIKIIGEVIALTGSFPGFVVRIERYPNGRKLPAPRILTQPDGKAFPSRFTAMDALATWKQTPQDVHQVKASDPAPRPASPVRTQRPDPVVPIVNDMQDYEHDALHEKQARAKRRQKLAATLRKARERKLGTDMPVVVKMPPCPVVGRSQRCKRDKTDLTIDQMIALGQVTVREVADAPRRNYWPKRGGAMPGHVDPRVLVSAE